MTRRRRRKKNNGLKVLQERRASEFEDKLHRKRNIGRGKEGRREREREREREEERE